MNSLKVIQYPVGAMAVNCLLLRDESGVGAVVDPGGDFEGSDAERIRSACLAEGIDVKYIILTHAHFDHMLSLERLRELTGAPLAVHSADAPALAEPSLSMMSLAGVDTPCKPAEVLLEEGDKLELGGSTLRVIHTPGHTPGSICLRCGGILITGDTLFRGTIGRHDFAGGDLETLMGSLERLKSLTGGGELTLYPGHGEPTTLSHELRFNPFLKS